MNLKFSILLASGLLVGSAIAYTAATSSSPDSRRTFLTQSLSTTLAVTGWTTGAAGSPPHAFASEGSGEDGFVTTESGLRYKVLTEGTGAVPAPGQTVKAHYTGMTVRTRHVDNGNSSRPVGTHTPIVLDVPLNSHIYRLVGRLQLAQKV
jgi:hypothetical protein